MTESRPLDGPSIVNAMKLYRLIALSIAISLAWQAAPAVAAPPKGSTKKKTQKRGKQAPDPLQPDPAIIEQARTLSDEAFLRFDTRDYAGAVSLWREAEQVLPLDPIYVNHRRHFIIQIAYAYEQSYEFSGDPDELAAAREQFEVYLASLAPDDVANHRLITREIEEIDALAQAVEREALFQRQENYDDYLAHYARRHWGDFAIGRGPEPDEVLDSFELLEHMGQPDMAKNYRRFRKMSIAGWSLFGLGFPFLVVGALFAASEGEPNKAAISVAAGGGAIILTGLGLGLAGTTGLERLDIDGAIENYNTGLARERGLIELRPSSALPPRLRRFERATGFRVGITVQGLQL